MNRTRAWRRHQHQRTKLRRAMTPIGKYFLSLGVTAFGQHVITRQRCSCLGCGNQRRYEGITLQERKAGWGKPLHWELEWYEDQLDEWYDYWNDYDEWDYYVGSVEYEGRKWLAAHGPFAEDELPKLLDPMGLRPCSDWD